MKKGISVVILVMLLLYGCVNVNSYDLSGDMNSSNPVRQQTTTEKEQSPLNSIEKVNREASILTEPDYHYISDYLFSIKDEIQLLLKDSENEFANQNLHGFGYLTKVHAKHFAALEENPEAVVKLDMMATIAESIQREENTENLIELMNELNYLIDELAELLNVDRNTGSKLGRQKMLNEITTELQARDDLTIVDDPSSCKKEEVFCFDYEHTFDTIVEMTLDDAQKEFYQLMLSYQLPEVPKEGDEPEGYSGIVFYENGYSFYKDSKMLFSAPGHSMETVKPSEDQYFGIVMYWVRLYGKITYPGTFETKEDAKSHLNGMTNLKQFAKDKVVLDWIEDTSEALQKYIDSDENETLRIEAWKRLNYFGNVVDIYMYENEFY